MSTDCLVWIWVLPLNSRENSSLSMEGVQRSRHPSTILHEDSSAPTSSAEPRGVLSSSSQPRPLIGSVNGVVSAPDSLNTPQSQYTRAPAVCPAIAQIGQYVGVARSFSCSSESERIASTRRVLYVRHPP